MNTLNNDSWTIGIITNNLIIEDNVISLKNDQIIKILDSIKSIDIPNEKHEIIIVGGNNFGNLNYKNIKIINFDETIKKAWITKKKNIIIDESKFENIILIHDYVYFDKNWYKGYLEFESDWDVSMCQIRNKDNVRWRDWLLWWCGTAPYRIEHNGKLLPANRLLYDDIKYVNNDMYINGTVIIGKKEFLKNNKFDENRVWGQGEDCEWSARCRPTWKYKMNIKSTLRLLKQKED